MNRKLRDRVLYQILKNQQLQLQYGALETNNRSLTNRSFAVAETETEKLLNEIDESSNMDRSGERT